MTSKELIKRIIHHDNPTRIGFSFLGENNPTDIQTMISAEFVHPVYSKYEQWGMWPELKKQVPWFKGEVRGTYAGNIFGRLDDTVQGECIKGAVQDGWEVLETLQWPVVNEKLDAELQARNYQACDKYMLTCLPFAVFAPLRDGRHMDNALMDIILEPENVCRFLDKTTDLAVEAIRRAAKNGADGAIIYDDLGMQHALFFSPEHFREIFKPYYKKLADELHNNGMDFFVHSCGKNGDIIPDFIEAGVDVFQFDQPELHQSMHLAKEYGDKVAFYCPVDIQKIMPTGDKKIIQEGAKHMVDAFKTYGKGSLIVKDYGNWQDLGVKPEWQQWARDVVIEHAKL